MRPVRLVDMFGRMSIHERIRQGREAEKLSM